MFSELLEVIAVENKRDDKVYTGNLWMMLLASFLTISFQRPKKLDIYTLSSIRISNKLELKYFRFLLTL